MCEHRRMNSSFFRRLCTPGAISPGVVEAVSILAMVALFGLERATGAQIWLHVLYMFPLVALAIHCGPPGLVALGFLMTVGFQIVTIFANESSALARSVNSLVALAWPILVVLLARFARASYFDIADLANQDPLTGLPSRRQFESIIEREIARQKRYGGVFSLAIMGFDNFKALNESRGYRVGDEALKVLAKLLRENTRRSDSIARLSGDEFAILLPNTRRADCTSLCNKLSIMIANRMSDEGVATSASVGGATFENAPESTSDALQKADRAMSAIKADRKGYAAAVLTLAARRRRRQAG
ncbi:putative Diguanylate cyclase [Burkholderiales bacterium]|nr:putative Diguanylate cyclase [Burkholderiales bacterium]